MNYSLDDEDNFSNISRISCGLHNSLNSTCNSDSECSGPVSVRDMIQHYNKQITKCEPNDVKPRNTYKLNAAKRHHHSSQHLLAATKSSYCGINNYGSCLGCKQFADHIVNDNHNQTTTTCCKKCTMCSCCQNGSHTNSSAQILSSTSSSSYLMMQSHENNNRIEKPNNNFNTCNFGCENCKRPTNANCNKINAKDIHILAVENYNNNNNNNNHNDVDSASTTGAIAANNNNNISAGLNININDTSATTIKPALFNKFRTELTDTGNRLLKNYNSTNEIEKQQQQQQQHCSPSTDIIEEANICQQTPNETSYQSKTTIAKTSSGVRIIIDIFFDQERCAKVTDLVGSRVETDIPESRILTEFQQQTLAAKTANTEVASNSF